MKTIRLVAANIVIFLSLWMLMSVLIAVAGDVWDLGLKPLVRSTDSRAALPAYPDHELARQIFSDQKAADYRYVPFVEWRHRPYASKTVNIDTEGRRVHTSGTANRSPATTIGFFGGSTMWGTGADDNGTIPAFFDQLTDEYEVINYGERGYTSRQNLEDLINLSVTRRLPKVVVFYSGYNDTWVHCNYAVTRNLNGHIREARLADALSTAEENESATYKLFIQPIVRLITEVTGRAKRSDEFACSSDPLRAEAVADMIVENWSIAELLVSRQGGKFYAFLQPNVHVGSPKVDYLRLSEDRLQRGSEFAAVYPRVRRKIAERGLSWARDLSDALDINEPVYIDDAHVAPQGNRILAGQIRRLVSQRNQVAGPWTRRRRRRGPRRVTEGRPV